MIDHAELIRSCWHRRHEPLVRQCIYHAILMLRASREHGMHKVWAHKPVTRR